MHPIFFTYDSSRRIIELLIILITILMDPFTKLIDCENDFANSEVLLYNLADDSLFF